MNEQLRIALAASKPLEVELLISDDARRRVTVDDHAAFQKSLAPDHAGFDAVDELVAAPEGGGTDP